MEASTVDTANKKLTLLGIYKRDLAEAQRTAETLTTENMALQIELRGLRREAMEHTKILRRCESYRDLAVMLGVIAAIETIVLLVQWGVR